MKGRDIFLNFSGALLLIVGFLAVAYAIYVKNPADILWFCYTAIILSGIAILRRDSRLLLAQLLIWIIPLIVWNIDFWYRLFSGFSLFGITDYFFLPSRDLIANIISFQHIYIIPIAFGALYLFKIKKNGAWKIALAEILFLFILTKIFTFPEINVNCVYYPCIPISISIPYWIAWWLSVAFIILITNYFLTNIRWFKAKITH